MILSVFEYVCMEIRFTILLEMVDLFAQKAEILNRRPAGEQPNCYSEFKVYF